MKRTLRLVLFAAPILGLALAAFVLAFGPGSGGRAQAGAVLNFSLGVDFNGDGTNDCGTGAPAAIGLDPASGLGARSPAAPPVEVSNTTCNAAPGAKLQVNVYLMNAGGIVYGAEAATVFYTGVTSNAIAVPSTSVWKCHLFDATATGVNFENAGSARGTSAPCNVGQTNLGLMNQFSFTCAAGGTLRLGHGQGETGLVDSMERHEAGPEDTLTINCGVPATTPPADTPTNTPPAQETPTNTSVPGTPPTATNTPTRTNTPVVTTPPPATATRTRTPTPAISKCDVDGDHHITSTDALWLLWKDAGTVRQVPLPENADCNHDGHQNSIDALFILWIEGGRLPAPH